MQAQIGIWNIPIMAHDYKQNESKEADSSHNFIIEQVHADTGFQPFFNCEIPSIFIALNGRNDSPAQRYKQNFKWQ